MHLSNAVIARLPLVACTLACMAAPVAATPTGSPSAPSLRPPATATQRAFEAWRDARGIDPSRAPTPDFSNAPVAPEIGAGGNPDDVFWQAGFGLPVPDRFVTSLLEHDGLLIAGGDFTSIGDLEVSGIAAWNGTSWSRFGEFPGSYVLDMAPYPGGMVALDYWSGVSRWDGAQWVPLGSVLYSAGFIDMAVLDQRVAVCGWAYEAGGWRSRVFLYDGNDWTALGGAFDNTVEAVAWYGGELYCGGSFNSVDGAPVPLVACWDGVAWQSLAAEVPSLFYDRVRALEVYGGELVAGGDFLLGADASLEVVSFASWNGTRWVKLGTGAPSYPSLARMRTVGSELYVMGHLGSIPTYGIARWDGAAWHTEEDRLQQWVHDVAFYGGDLYAGGALSIDGTRAAPPLVRRRGGVWSSPLIPGSRMKGLLGWGGPGVNALADLETGVVAGGRFDFAGAPGGWARRQGTALWDVDRWSQAGSRSWNDFEPFAFASHGGVLHAIGYFSGPAGYAPLARFDQGEWCLIADAPANPSAIASAFGDLFVGGQRRTSNAVTVARWNGATWSEMSVDGDYVSALALHEGELIAAGSLRSIGGVPCRNIAAWSPDRGWRDLSEGLTSDPYAIVTDLISRGGVLYASGGNFSPPGSEPSGVARWKDGRWEPIPGLGYYAWALGWFRGQLVASAERLGNIFALDADDQWRPFGSGLNGTALSFVERGQSLFVGGFFSRAGDKAAYGFAEWREPGPPGPAPEPTAAASPNPFASFVSLRYELPTGTRTRVEIFDLAGHRVEQVFDGYQSAGPQEVVWRPQGAAAGVYFARVITETTSQLVRVVPVQ